MSTMETNQRRATAESTEEEIEDGCSECGGDLEQEDTETYCTECGLVEDSQNIDRGPEWRAFNQQEDEEKSRVGDPLTSTMHDRGMSTTVGNSSDSLDEKDRRLRKWQKRIVMGQGKKRNLQGMLGDIWRLVSELDLPKHVEEGAANIVRKASKEDLIRGRSQEAAAAASVLLASRMGGNAVSLTEVVELVSLGERTQTRIQRTYKKFNLNLGMEVPPPDPKDCINPFLEDLRMPIRRNDNYKEFKNCVERVVEDAKQENLHSGCDPRSVAGGAVYFVARKRDLDGNVITQNKVGNAYDLSNVTIRNRYQEIEEVRSLD